MVFGNPQQFAIQIDPVPEWGNAAFCEGLFCIYLNWQRLGPQRVRSETLDIAIRQLLNSLQHPTYGVIKPLSLLNLTNGKNDIELLLYLHALTYPVDARDDSVDNCWDYVISPDALTDVGFCLFLYKNAESEVLIGGAPGAKMATSTSMPIGSTLSIATQAYQYITQLPTVLST